uniref:Pyrrolo-quinoline quinone n=1 Tax=Solibacter usitatus (strain Ellin6076) TaxID=234267 RepID=Q01VM9_SOLUE
MRSAALLLLYTAACAAQVLTAQYDNARTGATLRETALTPANVNVASFGKLFSFKVDGDVYAQPLYLPGVPIPGKGVHNVIYIATEHNSVYAFDASGVPAEPLWHVNFLNAAAGIGAVPARDVACRLIAPEIGITPTPVIDLKSGTLYVLARTKETHGVLSPDRYVQKLHALAVTTGAEKLGGPVEIRAPGPIAFDGLRQLPRAALLLSGGQVYLTWGSSCDAGHYYGWVMAYDARTLAQSAVLNVSPDAAESGIWQSDNGPAADEQGNVYVATGNGRFTAATGGRDYGDTLLKLSGSSLQVLDYFTPSDERALNSQDADLGSGGPMLLPPQLGEIRRMALIGGKDGSLYVLDRARLGKFQESTGKTVQTLHFADGIYSAPAYWNGRVYLLPSENSLQSFPVRQGKLADRPDATGAQRFGKFGATPAISADGARNGIVWLIETKAWNGADRPAVLHAYDAANVARELWNSEQNRDRDRAGLTLRFTIPTVVDGRVYVDAKSRVDVYGLLSNR